MPIDNATHARLAMAVTEYDRREQEKARAKGGYHSVYALPLYLGAVANVAADVERGAAWRDAIIAAFSDRLLAFVLRQMKLPKLTPEERDAKRYGLGVYVPVTEVTE